MTTEALIVEQELLPCPFCGARIIHVMNGIQQSSGGNWTKVAWCVYCQSHTGEQPNEAEAITAWNTRTLSRPLPDREARWRPIETAPEWIGILVSDGQNVAISGRSQDDDGEWYWAVDPEDALWFEPTMWTDAPPESLAKADAILEMIGAG